MTPMAEVQPLGLAEVRGGFLEEGSPNSCNLLWKPTFPRKHLRTSKHEGWECSTPDTTFDCEVERADSKTSGAPEVPPPAVIQDLETTPNEATEEPPGPRTDYLTPWPCSGYFAGLRMEKKPKPRDDPMECRTHLSRPADQEEETHKPGACIELCHKYIHHRPPEYSAHRTLGRRNHFGSTICLGQLSWSLITFYFLGMYLARNLISCDSIHNKITCAHWQIDLDTVQTYLLRYCTSPTTHCQTAKWHSDRTTLPGMPSGHSWQLSSGCWYGSVTVSPISMTPTNPGNEPPVTRGHVHEQGKLRKGKTWRTPFF